MKEEKIKPLPFVKELSGYFFRRAKRVLKVKKSEIETASVEIHLQRGTIWVWLHCKDGLIRAQFYFDGQCYHKYDNRLEEKEAK